MRIVKKTYLAVETKIRKKAKLKKNKKKSQNYTKKRYSNNMRRIWRSSR